jgi:hypothetical protein
MSGEMGSIHAALMFSASLISGVAFATPLVGETVDYYKEQHAAASPSRFHVDSVSNNAQIQIEQASEEFDSFILQVPFVIKAKFASFIQHGFKAILMEDSVTKPAEEKMIKSLTNGLRNIGDALEDDIQNYTKERKGLSENSSSTESEYHGNKTANTYKH